MQRAVVAAGLALASCSAPARSPSPPTATPAATPAPVSIDKPPPSDGEGAWSAAVGGLRARLIMTVPPVADQDTLMARTWIELDNVSDVGNPMELYWDDDAILEFTLEDDQGKPVDTGAMAASITKPPPFWLAIPVESSLRVSVTTYGYGVFPDKGLFIGLPAMRAWQLDRDDGRTYRLRARINVREGASDSAHRQAWEGLLELPPVTVPRSTR